MKVAVIGGGASGLMSAYSSAKNGNDVTVFEKNEKCGKKIYITGKGRCNVTNDVSPSEILNNVVNNSKFLTSAVYSFTPEDLKELLNGLGLALKTERGNRVFPQSDKASDVTKCLEKACKYYNVNFKFNAEVTKISVYNSTVSGIIAIIDGKKQEFSFDKVIVCTGGISYPSTGSTGDGYKFARETGHTVSQLKPALCGFNLKGKFYSSLQGLSLKNVQLTALNNDKVIASFFGECLFTHFGISGPIVLSLSSLINRYDLNSVSLVLDLKPALNDEQLDNRLVRDFSLSPNKVLRSVMHNLLPSALIEEVILRSKVDGNKKVNSVSKAERGMLVKVLKSFEMRIASLRPIEEAIVTSGGVNVKQINPKTMESKLVKGLYFCGEVLDVDAFTGGFNLQIAFSSGFCAGNSITD